MAKPTLEKLPKRAVNETETMWLIKDGDRIIGMMTKYRNTRTETHPHKAFFGVGLGRTYLGAFYNKDGGKTACINAVVKAAGA